VKLSYDKLKKQKADQDKKDKEYWGKLFQERNEKFYEDLYQQIKSLITKEEDFFANIANVASILHKQIKVNWTGFYWLHDNGQLVLGSFQGPVPGECVRIDRGKGVCGTAAEKKKTQLVPDVHKFEGHVRQDSNSEIVVPIIVKDAVVGVLDLDSTEHNGFNQNDQEGLEKIVRLLGKSVRWQQLRNHTHRRNRPQSTSFKSIKIFVAGGIFGIVLSGVFFLFL